MLVSAAWNKAFSSHALVKLSKVVVMVYLMYINQSFLLPSKIKLQRFIPDDNIQIFIPPDVIFCEAYLAYHYNQRHNGIRVNFLQLSTGIINKQSYNVLDQSFKSVFCLDHFIQKEIQITQVPLASNNTNQNRLNLLRLQY